MIYRDFPEQKEKEAKSIRKEISSWGFIFNVVGEVKTRLTINLQSAEETIKF
jgi:hypothetical protein